MLPHPGFEIPDTFLQLRDRYPLLGDCRPKLNYQCLQGGDHGWHHSPERATKPTRHPTPVNGYLLTKFASMSGIGGVLNTSFNTHGKPIVMSPRDALTAFADSGLQALALEDFLVMKSTSGVTL